MSDSNKSIVKFLLFVIVAVIVAGWAVSLVVGILKMLIPIAIIGALGYGAYRVFGPKSLTGRRNRYLP